MVQITASTSTSYTEYHICYSILPNDLTACLLHGNHSAGLESAKVIVAESTAAIKAVPDEIAVDLSSEDDAGSSNSSRKSGGICAVVVGNEVSFETVIYAQ